MWWTSKPLYESLPQSVDKAQKTYSGGLASQWFSQRWSRSTLVLSLSNLMTACALLWSIGNSKNASFLKRCVADLSTPSPALESVRYQAPHHYNAEFRHTNKWRGPPGNHSNDVDVAWHEIELGAGGIWVSEEEVRLLNITGTPELPLHKVPEEHGGGYLAMLEVFHLLHCLNSLRMGLFYNYDYYSFLDEGVPDENIYSHFDHCIDMLRMNLMCNADVTPALFVDPLHNPLRRDALPNWSSMHTCRDFDAILEWNKHGPRSVRWRDAGANPAWDPNLEGAEQPFPPEGHEENGHHH